MPRYVRTPRRASELISVSMVVGMIARSPRVVLEPRRTTIFYARSPETLPASLIGLSMSSSPDGCFAIARPSSDSGL